MSFIMLLHPQIIFNIFALINWVEANFAMGLFGTDKTRHLFRIAARQMLKIYTGGVAFGAGAAVTFQLGRTGWEQNNYALGACAAAVAVYTLCKLPEVAANIGSFIIYRPYEQSGIHVKGKATFLFFAGGATGIWATKMAVIETGILPLNYDPVLSGFVVATTVGSAAFAVSAWRNIQRRHGPKHVEGREATKPANPAYDARRYMKPDGPKA